MNRMMQNDAFSRWLGIEVLKIERGFCRLVMRVRADMLNGFGIAHGGITYSLADSALAFASNAGGRQSLSVETSINHVKRVEPGAQLTAEARLLTETEKLGYYEVRVWTTQSEEPVALFKGMVFRTAKEWVST